jgi:hypothetical protein
MIIMYSFHYDVSCFSFGLLADASFDIFNVFFGRPGPELLVKKWLLRPPLMRSTC